MVVNVFTRYWVKAPLPVITAFILLDLMPQAFLRIPPRLFWVGWGLLLGSSFLVCPGMFNWVQLRDLAGPLTDIQSVGHEPLLCWLGWKCVLSHCLIGRSEVLNTLGQVFFNYHTVLYSVFPSTLTTEKHPHIKLWPSAESFRGF